MGQDEENLPLMGSLLCGCSVMASAGPNEVRRDPTFGASLLDTVFFLFILSFFRARACAPIRYIFEGLF